MRAANVGGRLALVTGDRAVDVDQASGGRFSADPQAIYDVWDDFRAWADTVADAGEPFDRSALGAPAPRPRQVLALALNFAPHAAEAGRSIPPAPSIFTKFPTCIGGPYGEVTLPSNRCDYEVELVVVMGKHTERVAETDVWSHVAGVAIGQDLTDRQVQFIPPMPQFSMGKSFPGFGPMGPTLVTPDELDDPDDIEISCSINGEELQKGRTSELVFSVPQVIAYSSAITPLLPGDAIFMGTLSGIGFRRTPPRFIQPGDELVTTAVGIGEMRHTFRYGDHAVMYEELPAPLA